MGTTLETVAAVRRDVSAWFAGTFPNADYLQRATYVLLSSGDASAKLSKNEIPSWGLSMIPFRCWFNPSTGETSTDYVDGWQYLGNVCAGAERADCWRSCIASTGHYGMGQSAARLWVRVLWHLNRPLFLRLLTAELRALNARAWRESRRRRRRVLFAVRLNVISDIPWHRYVNLAEFDRLSFYGYTKVRGQLSAAASVPNLDLTYSVSVVDTLRDLKRMARNGVRLAVVVPDADAADAPTWAGIPAVNGDTSDYRPNDPAGVAVLLRIKRSTDGTSADQIYRAGMVRDAKGRILATVPN